MPGRRPVNATFTATGLVPPATAWPVVVVVPVINVGSVPYTKLIIAALPFGFTLPLSVAPVVSTPEAACVVATGKARVTKLRIVPVVVPPELDATTSS